MVRIKRMGSIDVTRRNEGKLLVFHLILTTNIITITMYCIELYFIALYCTIGREEGSDGEGGSRERDTVGQKGRSWQQKKKGKSSILGLIKRFL